MKRIDIRTCRWLSPEWVNLIREGYHTVLHDQDDPHLAVMWRGSAARDLIRNTDMPQQWRKQ
jgi:hypothetical protein